MHSLRHILSNYQQLLARGDQRLAMATVVEVQGSTYHRPGARMLITESLDHAGSISGGCLEKDLLQKCWWHLEQGPALLTYDTRIEDDEDIGSLEGPFTTGCSGVVHILLEEICKDHPLCPIKMMQDIVKRKESLNLLTIYRCSPDFKSLQGKRMCHRSEHPVATNIPEPIKTLLVQALGEVTNPKGPASCHSFVDSKNSNLFFDVLIEPIHPARCLYLFGAGDDAIPVAQQAASMGWDLYLVDRRQRLANRERFPAATHIINLDDLQALKTFNPPNGSIAVIMSHNILRDAKLIPALVNLNFDYIGVLGPKARTNRLIHYWQESDIPMPKSKLEEIHSPIGLDIGANNATEISFSIISEIIAHLNSRKPDYLKNQMSPLHKPPMHQQHFVSLDLNTLSS